MSNYYFNFPRKVGFSSNITFINKIVYTVIIISQSEVDKVS